MREVETLPYLPSHLWQTVPASLCFSSSFFLFCGVSSTENLACLRSVVLLNCNRIIKSRGAQNCTRKSCINLVNCGSFFVCNSNQFAGRAPAGADVYIFAREDTRLLRAP
ncbi:hypothetical protein PUN28_004611 [Cardiocondyla obscurior]|uniref:Secreted protein n=1 Tax=Cardiocondyla obscurior TaxID=286306 RepID=A0AAW2GEQ2_9HYME